jgi:hypothetical protein
VVAPLPRGDVALGHVLGARPVLAADHHAAHEREDREDDERHQMT